MKKVCDREKNTVQGDYMLFRGVIWMFRRVAYCSGGLYAVHVGYMDVQEGCILLRGVICCSGEDVTQKSLSVL